MRHSTLGGWAVAAPEDGLDPFLAAALWLIEKNDGALVADHVDRVATIHARILFETVPRLNLHSPSARSAADGIGIVLVTPTAQTLEIVDRDDFAASAEWMLLPSPPYSPDRAFQDAWLWALNRPAPTAGARASMPDYDLSSLLTPHEVWALAVRSRMPSAQLEALRAAAVSDGLYLQSVTG